MVTKRPGLEQVLAYAREGDTVVVWRLDRLGRSIQHLLQTVVVLLFSIFDKACSL